MLSRIFSKAGNIGAHFKVISCLHSSTSILPNYVQCIPHMLKWNGDVNNVESLVLYEDNHLLVVYKPSCVLMQGDMNNEDNLLSMCKRYLQKKYNKPGSAYLGLVHRLDRVTSGVCVFAKTSKAAARLSSAFKNRSIMKYYLCVVNGVVKEQAGELSHLLIKSNELRTQVLDIDEGKDRSDAVTGVLKYNTLYSNINSGKSCNQAQSLLAVELETGRKHQIRAQFSHIQHPVVGDVKYGAPQRFKTRDIALHSAVLSFPHPTTHFQVVCLYCYLFLLSKVMIFLRCLCVLCIDDI